MTPKRGRLTRDVILLALALTSFVARMHSASTEWVALSPDRTRFVLSDSGVTFAPYGFNYNRNAGLRLIEDYWGETAEQLKTRSDAASQLTLAWLEIFRGLNPR